ncbi:MAG: MTH938/NDUFAF3 family protein [Wenzhouxiangella sp.]|jgi:uncharacterized protein|nr:MTH938/NDUFAF3 family protein [Wenzhouxiangella sp.]
MLNWTEHQPGNHHIINAVHDDHVVISDRRIDASVIVGARLLEESWPVCSLSDLSLETIEPLLALTPELVVIGCGTRPGFPDAQIQSAFLSRGIGLESMTLNAAARTFNILMSENRRALAALIL